MSVGKIEFCFISPCTFVMVICRNIFRLVFSLFIHFLCYTSLISHLLLVSMFVYLWFCLYTWLSFGAECLVFQFAIQIKIKIYRAIIRRSQRPRGLRRGLRPVACWDYWFESRRADGCCRCLVSAVCCQVEASVTG
jgi:hypothetical protein